jgi:hypothetical protein
MAAPYSPRFHRASASRASGEVDAIISSALARSGGDIRTSGRRSAAGSIHGVGLHIDGAGGETARK